MGRQKSIADLDLVLDLQVARPTWAHQNTILDEGGIICYHKQRNKNRFTI